MFNKFVGAVLALLVAGSAFAQNAPNNGGIMVPNTAPTTGAAPTGPAGGSLKGTYPNPGLADVNSIATSLAVGGCTIGTDTVCAKGQFASTNTTGTSPGFYASITGDTVPRVRIGMDATDTPSLAFGSGSATRDAFFYRTGAAAFAAGGSISTTNASITAGSFIPTSSTAPTNGMYLAGANSVGFSTNSALRWFFTTGGSFNANGSGRLSLSPGAPSATSPNVIINSSDSTTGIGAQASGNISLIVAAAEIARVVAGGPIVLPSTAISAGGTAGAGYKFSSATNFGVFFGSGVPTLSAAKGSLYLRSDGTTVNDRMYVNTDGSTTWTNVVTGG